MPALYPFHSASSGDFWTSNDVKATTTFGYTYPELQQSGNLTAAISSAINSLYGPNSGKTIGRSNTSATKRDVESKANQFRKRAIAGAPSFVLGRAYQADISVKKFGLGGSFTIYIFLGEPTTKPSDWSSDPNFVGINGVFSMAMPAAGNSDLMVHGVVPLTAALEDAVNCGEIPDLSEPVVVPYLKEKLVWKIQKVSQRAIRAFVAVSLETKANISARWIPPKFRLPKFRGSISRSRRLKSAPLCTTQSCLSE